MGSQWFSIIINGYQDISRIIKIYRDGQSFEFLSTWLYHYLTLAMVFLCFSRISPSLASPPFLPFLPFFSPPSPKVNFWKSSLRPTACSRIWTNPCRGRMCLMFGRGNQVSHVSLPGRQMAMWVAKANENRAVKHLEFLKFCWKFWMGNWWLKHMISSIQSGWTVSITNELLMGRLATKIIQNRGDHDIACLGKWWKMLPQWEKSQRAELKNQEKNMRDNANKNGDVYPTLMIIYQCIIWSNMVCVVWYYIIIFNPLLQRKISHWQTYLYGSKGATSRRIFTADAIPCMLQTGIPSSEIHVSLYRSFIMYHYC